MRSFVPPFPPVGLPVLPRHSPPSPVLWVRTTPALPFPPHLWFPSTVWYLCRLRHEETGRYPKFLGNPFESVPRARDSGDPNGLALSAVQFAAFDRIDSLGFATSNDFGAESSRPTFLLSTLQPRPVTRPEARLATGLPATALTGLDFHQLDSFERFPSAHVRLPPLPSLAWRDDSDSDAEFRLCLSEQHWP